MRVQSKYPAAMPGHRTDTMMIRDAKQELGTVAGVRDWHGKSTAAPPVRILERRESNPPLPPLRSTPDFRRRALYARRNRQAARPEVAGGSGLCCETRNHPRLVS